MGSKGSTVNRKPRFIGVCVVVVGPPPDRQLQRTVTASRRGHARSIARVPRFARQYGAAELRR